MRRISIRPALLLIGLSMLTTVLGSAVFALDGSRDPVNKRVTDHTNVIHSIAVVEENNRAQRNDNGRQLSESNDPRSEMIMPCRNPGCGPWKNAINHMHCGSGYDVY